MLYLNCWVLCPRVWHTVFVAWAIVCWIRHINSVKCHKLWIHFLWHFMKCNCEQPSVLAGPAGSLIQSGYCLIKTTENHNVINECCFSLCFVSFFPVIGKQQFISGWKWWINLVSAAHQVWSVFWRDWWKDPASPMSSPSVPKNPSSSENTVITTRDTFNCGMFNISNAFKINQSLIIFVVGLLNKYSSVQPAPPGDFN